MTELVTRDMVETAAAAMYIDRYVSQGYSIEQARSLWRGDKIQIGSIANKSHYRTAPPLAFRPG